MSGLRKKIYIFDRQRERENMREWVEEQRERERECSSSLPAEHGA